MKDDKKVSHILQLYLQWPVFLTALVILAGAAVNLISRKAGFVMLAFTVIYAACAGTLYMYGKKRALGSLVSFASAYSWSQKQLMASLELPYAIADTDGKILWMNRAFEAVTKEEKSAGKSLTMLFKEITVESLEKMENAMEVHVIYGESKYRVSMKRVTIRPDELASGIPEKQTEQQILAVYLYDETELYNYKQAITDQKMVAGLIYLDNYDEALESVEEVRRSLLTALIDRKINKYISAVNGIVKKLEKDKYFFAIKQCYMPRLEKERFGLLEEVKTVNIGNEMAVTLSIGIGMNGDTYSQNYDYARTAIDMALGRGGDQAAVKTVDGFEFYGGISHGVEKRSHVRSRIIANALCDLIRRSDSVIIMGHRMSDLDAIGSAIGALRICKMCGVPAVIAVNSEATLAGPLLKTVIDAGEGHDFIAPDQTLDVITPNTLLIVVDTYQKRLLESQKIYEKCSRVVVIDHHRMAVGHIDNPLLLYHEPYASSASELVCELLQFMPKENNITPLEANALLAGIMLDTRSFALHVGVRTFEAAAWLRSRGAQTADTKLLFNTSKEEYEARAHIVEGAYIYRGCAIALSDELDAGMNVVLPMAANDLLTINGVDASFVAVAKNGGVNISARSMGALNVQVILEPLGGGGHLMMAGAQLQNCTLEDAEQRIREQIDLYRAAQKENIAR